jgi:2-polyprenyl-6-methoxyphenol hydroxylase-like FAD-dependent oxidoreductase
LTAKPVAAATPGGASARDVDVLVVGAGPTGLMLANQLARRNVSVRLVDRHGGPARETRALGVQARTLEVYARLGIVDRALELGKPATGANIWADGRHLARVPLGDAGRHVTPYPYILILGQDDNERILGERLRALGGDVEWKTELVALAPSSEDAVATLRHADGTAEAVRARWVAGCDGAHSAVRQLTGIDFPGAPYEHVFFVADVEVTGSMTADEVNVYLWRAGFHLFFPMRGRDHWRIVGIVPAGLRDRKDLRFDDVVPSVQGEAGLNLAFRHCSWFSTYRIHHRSAARFRAGRCFVLGDAAHIHSPVGAQGMNTGLQDAYNLGWKLALVAQGRAGASLLDSYEAERLPVARRLLQTTDRAFRLVVANNVVAGLLRTEVLARVAALAMGQPSIQRIAFRTVSQTGIGYRHSALSVDADGPPADAPRAGDRFPWLRVQLAPDAPPTDLFDRLDDTRWTLIVVGQALPAAIVGAFPGDLDTITVLDSAANDAELARAQVPRPSFYLLRPDGHVGLRGARLDVDALARYARDTVHLGSGAASH